MKRIILLIAIFSSFTALAQTPRTYRIEGIAQRFSTALGIPVKASSFFNTSSDTAIVFIDPSDTTTIHFKYKGVAKKLAASNIPWDSITAKPSNFTTTYALSNDVRDSVQNRVPYENATRSLVLGNYRLSARGLLGDTIYTRSSTGGVLANNSGQAIANYGAGGGVDISFNGFAGMDYNRSGSMSNLSFTPKVYTDSLLNLKSNITDSTDLLSKTVRTFGNQSGILGNKIFTNNITANSLIKSSGTADQLLVANGDVQSKADIHNGAFTFDTTGRLLTIQTLGGGTYSVLIPRGTASGAEGITALTSSKVGNLVTVFGDNGSSTTFSIRDADSAITARLSDSTLFNSGRWLPNRSEDSIKVLRALINTKGVGTVTSVTASGPLSSSGGATPNITITQANTSTNGFLSSTDWNTFNNKVSYTDALARAALSFTAGSGAYNSTTGVITIPTNTNQITNGAGFITLNDSSTINADRWLPNRSEDSIKVIRALANSKGIGSVTSVAVTAGTGISVTGSPITGAGTINVVNTAPDQVVTLTAGTGISVSGTYPNFTVTNTSTSTGTVTSVGLTAPTGFNVSSSPITSAGTIGLSFASGYSLPTTASQSLWDVAYNKRLSSASLTSSTLTLTLGDASTVTTSVPTFNQNTTGSAATLSAVLSASLGGAGATNGILKANGSGVVSAATAADIPSLSSYYLSLAGGTMNQGADLNMVGNDPGNGFISFRNVNNSSRVFRLTAGKPNINQTGFSIFDQTANAIRFHIKDNGDYEMNGAVAMTGALSGTSLSMSGAGTFGGLTKITGGTISTGSELSLAWNGTTGGAIQTFASKPLSINPLGNRILFGTSTDNGLTDYQFSGTAGFTKPIYAGGASANPAVSVGATGSDYGSVGYGFFYGVTNDTYLGADYASRIRFASGGFQLQTAPIGTSGATITWSTPFSIANSGAASFSSSVTAIGILKTGGTGGVGIIAGARTTMINNNYAGHFDGIVSLAGAGGLGGVALGYSTTRTNAQQVIYLNASDGTNPDFLVQNAAGTTVTTISNSGAITANSYVKGAGFRQSISYKTSNYTLTATDHTVIFDVSSSAKTATLPAGVEGQIYVIGYQNISNNLTIVPNGSETIAGASSFVINSGTCINAVTIQFLSGNWYIISTSYNQSCL